MFTTGSDGDGHLNSFSMTINLISFLYIGFVLPIYHWQRRTSEEFLQDQRPAFFVFRSSCMFTTGGDSHGHLNSFFKTNGQLSSRWVCTFTTGSGFTACSSSFGQVLYLADELYSLVSPLHSKIFCSVNVRCQCW